MKIAMKALAVGLGFANPAALADTVSPDAILGVYLNPDRTRTVKIYEEADRYFGVIATAPSQPDGSEGVGFVVFRDFVFNDARAIWEGGQLDSPMFPKVTFSGSLSLDASGNLVVHGFVGVPLLGGSSVFPRVE